LTLGLEPEADATAFEVAPIPIDSDGGDTKNASSLPPPTTAAACDTAFLEFSAYRIFTPTMRLRR